jgi:hypothetical protein
VILGVYSNLPWFVPAYYTIATLGGAALLGIDVQRAALEDAMSALGSLSWRDLRSLGRTLAPFMWAYTVGSTVGAVLLSGLAYRVSLAMILAHRQKASQVDRTPGQL